MSDLNPLGWVTLGDSPRVTRPDFLRPLSLLLGRADYHGGLALNAHPVPADSNQAYLLARFAENEQARQHETLVARYTENSEQAREHETLRERTTSMVFQTSGVMLGLLGFKEGSWQDNPISLFIAVFILLLGTWGLVSAIMSENTIVSRLP